VLGMIKRQFKEIGKADFKIVIHTLSIASKLSHLNGIFDLPNDRSGAFLR